MLAGPVPNVSARHGMSNKGLSPIISPCRYLHIANLFMLPWKNLYHPRFECRPLSKYRINGSDLRAISVRVHILLRWGACTIRLSPSPFLFPCPGMCPDWLLRNSSHVPNRVTIISLPCQRRVNVRKEGPNVLSFSAVSWIYSDKRTKVPPARQSDLHGLNDDWRNDTFIALLLLPLTC